MNTSGYYKSVIIAPPIQPDTPGAGKPSDHSVPVCVPHTDRYTRPQRKYRTIKYRPLPQSSVQRFGGWMVSESWGSVKKNISPTEQVLEFEKLLNTNLNKFCPEKEMKLGCQDKLFITAELKRLDRQNRKEYFKKRQDREIYEVEKTV